MKIQKKKSNILSQPLCFSNIIRSDYLSPSLGVFIPRQMASNTRYAPQGRLTRRSWTLRACLNCRVGCVQMNSPNTFIHSGDAGINASRGSKWMWCSVWRGGAEGAREGEWAKGRLGEGEGQISGEQIPHRSHCICAIKEATASDGGNCKGTCITFLYVQEADHRTHRAKGMRGKDMRRRLEMCFT